MEGEGGVHKHEVSFLHWRLFFLLVVVVTLMRIRFQIIAILGKNKSKKKNRQTKKQNQTNDKKT